MADQIVNSKQPSDREMAMVKRGGGYGLEFLCQSLFQVADFPVNGTQIQD